MAETSDARAAALRTRLLVAMLTPLTLLLGAGAMLAYQIQTFDQNARWVDHSDAVIATTYEVLKGVLDQETAVRGFMLTE
ncbi:MAG TPA: CHASE3 domain-containing protein, partial [Polyangiaceae bacterium]|nr:CHASE3 domain-containing protein [Polyangiaceae bacterium]